MGTWEDFVSISEERYPGERIAVSSRFAPNLPDRDNQEVCLLHPGGPCPGELSQLQDVGLINSSVEYSWQKAG